MKKSVFYKKCMGAVRVSVVLSTVGCGIYTVLSDNGYVPKVAELRSGTKIGKAISYIENIFKK